MLVDENMCTISGKHPSCYWRLKHSRNKNIERTSADDKISKAHFDEPKMIYAIREKGNAGWHAVHNCTVHTDHRLCRRLSLWCNAGIGIWRGVGRSLQVAATDAPTAWFMALHIGGIIEKAIEIARQCNRTWWKQFINVPRESIWSSHHRHQRQFMKMQTGWRPLRRRRERDTRMRLARAGEGHPGGGPGGLVRGGEPARKQQERAGSHWSRDR